MENIDYKKEYEELKRHCDKLENLLNRAYAAYHGGGRWEGRAREALIILGIDTGKRQAKGPGPNALFSEYQARMQELSLTKPKTTNDDKETILNDMAKKHNLKDAGVLYIRLKNQLISIRKAFNESGVKIAENSWYKYTLPPDKWYR